jgi:F-type H+-transporting ATPase subunit gamma
MPGAQERILKRRINSVRATRKITRAMELISASRVVRAQQRANAARPYAGQITKVIEDLAAGGANVDHPLLREIDDVSRVAYIVLSSDRGLAGAYNSAVIRAAQRELDAGLLDGQEYELVTIGRKALGYFRFRNYRVAHSYEGISDKPTYEDARQIAEQVTEMFVSGQVDRVILAYTEFRSLASQRVVVRRFLPLERTESIAENRTPGEPSSAFEFEPSPEAVLADLLPRYVEARLYAALLDAAASEHASRQRAMKSATDNADEIIIKLTRSMNRARQDTITTEIMEIISGAEGLKEDEEEEGEPILQHLMGAHVFPHDLDPTDGRHRRKPHPN